ncbi:cell division cycle and apoptosis regulator protein 1-like isoform X2 [Hibiscus syriacus]|uniref:cell division cycle and apoptosis regulator protein 1-like isoform X2 n=1 Tax=Hibiscus syriacus TaxID=106335 RepID=UPI00192424A7|nr:cell division cycle and apoptosis regulator protein 1-like isoform X2 [Hibiscus syriacus]
MMFSGFEGDICLENMSSKYQILDNRPIDQWKVTELKDELKRRKLTTRGLKEDLVKRLDEALRIERENTENEEDNGLNSDPRTIDESGVEKVMLDTAETVKDVVDHSGSEIKKESGVKVQVDINESAAALGHEGVQGRDSMVQEELIAQATTVQTDITVTKDVVSEVPIIGQALQSLGQNENVNIDIKLEYEDPKLQLETEDPKALLKNEGPKHQVESEGPKAEEPKGELECVGSKPRVESDDLKSLLDIEDSKVHPENDDSKAAHEDDMRDSSAPNIQTKML